MSDEAITMEFKVAPELFWIPTKVSSPWSYGFPLFPGGFDGANEYASAFPDPSTWVTVITTPQVFAPLAVPTTPVPTPTDGAEHWSPELKPPSLLLSLLKANVTDEPAASPEVQLSETAPVTGEVPPRVIVPVKAKPVLFVMVKIPVSGPAQIVPFVLQTEN